MWNEGDFLLVGARWTVLDRTFARLALKNEGFRVTIERGDTRVMSVDGCNRVMGVETAPCSSMSQFYKTTVRFDSHHAFF